MIDERQPTYVTKYRRTSDLILRLIDEQDLGPGDQIPTEPQLAERANVSIITVRRAIGDLVARNILTRQQGRGTFVVRRRLLSSVGRPGPLRAGIGDGRMELHSRVIQFEEAPCPQRASRFLRVEAGRPCWEITRLREAESGPLLIDYALVPVSLAAWLRRSDVEGLASLYEVLESRYGLINVRDEQVLSVMPPLDEERDLLGLDHGANLVVVEGASFTTGDEPFAYFRLLFDAARFSFRIDGERPLLIPMPRELELALHNGG